LTHAVRDRHKSACRRGMRQVARHSGTRQRHSQQSESTQHSLSSRAICSRECLLGYISQLNAIRWTHWGPILRSSSAEGARVWRKRCKCSVARDPIISEKSSITQGKRRGEPSPYEGHVRALTRFLMSAGLSGVPAAAATSSSPSIPAHRPMALQEKSDEVVHGQVTFFNSFVVLARAALRSGSCN
jgi:hypothetical protein